MSRNRPYDSSEGRRSPRDRERSPAPQRYSDSRESTQQRGASYRGTEGPSRSSGDSRPSSNTFSERDFRDGQNRQANNRDFAVSLAPPRAPKSFPDAPTGPRAIVFSADSRGRGGSRARGRGWYDEGRDRGRDVDYDYRDRRDERGASAFRGDRGRERDWTDRDRRDRDNVSFRGRRPSSPGSAYNRGRPRGRGDWDSRGLGRGYDDRDRFRGRSRSPPSRRASMASPPPRPLMTSPPPQAPEVPAFGSVVNNQSATPTVSARPVFSSGVVQQSTSSTNTDNSLAAPITPPIIPTGPRSLQKEVYPVKKPTSVSGRSGSAFYTSSLQSSNRNSVEAQQDPSKVLPAPTKSTVRAAIVRKVTADSGQTPPIITPSEAIPAMLRLPLPRDIDIEVQESESESGEDMDDYFEAETRKVQEQLEKASLGNVEGILTYAAQDALDLHPILHLPQNISDDGDEVEELEIVPSPNPNISIAIEYENGDETDAEEEEARLAAVRPRMKTPPISSLPFEPIKPWNEDTAYLQEIENSATFKSIVEQNLAEQERRKEEHNEQLKLEYVRHYERYLRFCESDDFAAVKYRAKTAAGQKAASRAASLTPAAESRPEGRRAASRFATEHDIARVLQESKREALEKQEASERAAKAKAASDKEAMIPEMMSWEEYDAFRFVDTSHFVPFERAPAVLGTLPPIDNFTEEESEIFEKTYLDYPKQWSKIAAALPGRDYKNCIQHYYLVKHKDSLKDKLKKKEKGKKNRKAAGAGSKPKSNALMANLGPRDGETDDGQDTGDTGRKHRDRPRRAAAPIWPFEVPSESETATPAPTPGRRTASAAKADNPETAPIKRKGKGAAKGEKGPKQAKNGQLLAAAPSASAKTREEEKILQTGTLVEKLQPRGSHEPARYMDQWDGATQQPIAYLQPHTAQDIVTAPKINLLADKTFQSYDLDSVDSAQSNVAYDNQQQDRRSLQQTSSYWSVPEQTDFPALLAHFGTNWQAIARWMGSKTHIMVKNYYQRQVDSGKSDLEEIARTADGQLDRGESTGPRPTPTLPIKRRYDGPGSLQRPLGPTNDSTEDIQSASQSVMPYASPPLQPTITRFPVLAQAGQAAQTTQATHPPPVVSKPIQSHNQGQQWVQQMVPNRPPRGPPLGFFHSDRERPNHSERERPILQATTQQQHQQGSMALSDPIRSQRSQMAAQEAQMERQQALRLEEQQMQIARQQKLRLKQETEIQNLSQFEQYSTSAPQPSIMAQSRTEESSVYGNDARRMGMTQQYPPRNMQGLRDMAGDSIGPGLTPPKTNPVAQINRITTSAPPVQQEIPASRLQQPGIAAVRQQETVRKTSSIMSLLNDEPSEPRAPLPKRSSDIAASVVQPSQATATQQSLYQPTRSLSGDQQPQMRRKPSIGDVHNTNQAYPRSSGTSQSIRVIESPYTAATQSQAQARSQIASPMNTSSASERDSYSHTPFGMQRQPAISTPQQVPSYHIQQPQQPTHRQHAFGSGTQRTASPPGQYALHHTARHSSYDGHFSHNAATHPVPTQMHYSPTGGGTPVSMSYQPTSTPHHPHSSLRFPSHSAVPTSQTQPQMTQQRPLQHQQSSHHTFPPLPPQPQHHAQPVVSARAYSPPSFRPAPPPPQPSGLDRFNPDQQQTVQRQQILQQQQQQQQQRSDYGESYRRGEDRRYDDSRR